MKRACTGFFAALQPVRRMAQGKKKFAGFCKASAQKPAQEMDGKESVTILRTIGDKE
ncbi:MAG: hypothetical protein RSG59_09065 [Ruthenibacterium sp.]